MKSCLRSSAHLCGEASVVCHHTHTHTSVDLCGEASVVCQLAWILNSFERLLNTSHHTHTLVSVCTPLLLSVRGSQGLTL